MAKTAHLVVLMGGVGEREVPLSSGRGVAEALRARVGNSPSSP